jgi:hypothetical protein
MATLSPPATVLDLVERFDRNRDEYLSGRYNEAQLRQDFLNPFFEALGWDVQNKLGFAGYYCFHNGVPRGLNSAPTRSKICP